MGKLKNGLELSAITFGCWELGGGKWKRADDEANVALLRRAREIGVTAFDTAVNYGDGHSERVVGRALAPIRKDCVIATKVRPESLRPADVRASVRGSLQRLATDYIDVLYVHWPNAEIPLGETMGAFEALRREGTIRAIGVSNFSLSQLKEAREFADVEIVQMEYSLLARGIEYELVPYCTANQIALTSYSSMAKGILSGAFHLSGARLAADDFRQGRRLFREADLEAERPLILEMQKIAQAHGAQVAQVALCWVLNRPGILSAIAGTQDRAHLERNARAAEMALSAADMAALDRLSREALCKIDG